MTFKAFAQISLAKEHPRQTWQWSGNCISNAGKYEKLYDNWRVFMFLQEGK